MTDVDSEVWAIFGDDVSTKSDKSNQNSTIILNPLPPEFFF